MYPLTPMRVYVLEGAADDPACAARMERILGALGRRPETVRISNEQNLPEVIGELLSLWPPTEVPAGQVRTYTRPLVFTTMDLGAGRRDLRPLLERCPPGTTPQMLRSLFGQFPLAVDQHPHALDQQNDCVCWPTFNFGTMVGCPHGCLYCGEGREGRFLTIALNLEEYMEKVVGPIIEANPWSKVFRMILHGADLITFEPQYGLHDLFTRKLAQYEGRWGHFHTSSANVDWMAGLERRDRLVGVWSTSCRAMARDIEPGAGDAMDRVEAARKCQAMGIPVRLKFKPVIPVRNWREEYAWIIEHALRRVRPESMGFGLYMWIPYDSMIRSLPTELLDPECLEAARAAADRMKGVKTGPFPHETRAQIYRHLIREARRWDKDLPLYISTESREMWDELKDELGQDPRAYICACSSVAVPGGRLALSPGFRYSTYNPSPV